jgi:hypothetical protein
VKTYQMAIEFSAGVLKTIRALAGALQRRASWPQASPWHHPLSAGAHSRLITAQEL